MADFDLKDFVRKVAPTVATALGGPLAGGVVTGLSQIFLGRPDGTQADIASAAMSGALTGEQITELKKLEMQLRAEEAERGFKYADLEFQREKLYIQDVQGARERQVATKDNMPQIIFFLLLTAYIAEFCVFIYGKMPTDEFTRALVTRAFATVDTGLVGAIAYFIGSSRGSKNSGDAVRRIAEQQATTSAITAQTAAQVAADNSSK